MNRRDILKSLVVPTGVVLNCSAFATDVKPEKHDDPPADFGKDSGKLIAEREQILYDAMVLANMILPGHAASSSDLAFANTVYTHCCGPFIPVADEHRNLSEAAKLAIQLAHAIGSTESLPLALRSRTDRVEWIGDPLDTDIMPEHYWHMAGSYDLVRLPQAEKDALLRFFDGEQWQEDTKLIRKKFGLPCLVVNKLPVIASALLANAGYARQPAPNHIRIAVASRNREAQMLYNYQLSVLVERLA